MQKGVVMPIGRFFKISRKTFFDPKAWMDYDSFKDQNEIIKSSLANLFTVSQPEHEETFENALKRLHLTEADIKGLTKKYLTYAWIFLLVGILTFLYAFFLLFLYHALGSWLLGLAVATLFFSQAFKYHFWSFQMHRRQLGATIQDWKKYILSDEDSA